MDLELHFRCFLDTICWKLLWSSFLLLVLWAYLFWFNHKMVPWCVNQGRVTTQVVVWLMSDAVILQDICTGPSPLGPSPPQQPSPPLAPSPSASASRRWTSPPRRLLRSQCRPSPAEGSGLSPGGSSCCPAERPPPSSSWPPAGPPGLRHRTTNF